MDPAFLVFPALFMLIGFMLWLALSGWNDRHRTNVLRDLGTQLLAKAGSLADLGPFLQSEVGTNLVERLISEPPASSAKYQTLRAVQLGIVLLALAVCLIAIARFGSLQSREISELLGTFGLIVGSIGIGFLLSAVAGHWVASRLRMLD